VNFVNRLNQDFGEAFRFIDQKNGPINRNKKSPAVAGLLE